MSELSIIQNKYALELMYRYEQNVKDLLDLKGLPYTFFQYARLTSKYELTYLTNQVEPVEKLLKNGHQWAMRFDSNFNKTKIYPIVWDPVLSTESTKTLNRANIFHGISIVERCQNYYNIAGFAFPTDVNNWIDLHIFHYKQMLEVTMAFKNAAKDIINEFSKNKFILSSEQSDILFDEIVLQKKYSKKIVYNDITVVFFERELSCLYFLREGLTAKGIAKKLNLSSRTIESYLVNIKNKLGLHTKEELIQTINKFQLLNNYLP